MHAQVWQRVKRAGRVVFGVHPPPVRLTIRITLGYRLKD